MILPIATAGALLYGERWQAPLARALGVSREAVRLWAAGRHPVPADIRMRVWEMLRERVAVIAAIITTDSPV